MSCFVVEGGCALLFVFGADLLFFMLFDLIIMFDAGELLGLIFDCGAFVRVGLDDFGASRGSERHSFHSFAVL